MPEQIPITLRVGLDAPEAEQILVRFLKDYAEDAGRPRYVVGISGGLDSAVSAALAVRAVGQENLSALVLPDDATPTTDLDDADVVVRWLGVAHRRVSIQALVDAFESATDTPDRLALGNAKARARMMLLYDEAARRSGLVLGTGNKSELLSGYFSKHGDGGVDVQPLGDLYKTQVRVLARHLGVPGPILEKAPSAGLWSGQTDEEELGVTYDVLDRILLGLELRLPPPRIASIVRAPLETVERIESLRRATQHKRRPPMVPKMGLRTVGLDWRTATLER